MRRSERDELRDVVVGDNMIKLVFFDIGGTLVGSNNLFSYLAEKLGRKSDQSLEKFLSSRFAEIYANANPPRFKTVVQMIAELLVLASVEFDLEDLSRLAGEFYNDLFVDKAWLLDGAKKNLEFMKKNDVKLIVASDADSNALFRELKLLGIYDFFDHFIISSEVGAYKPSDPFVNQAKKYCEGINKREIYFVGDNKVDMVSAKKLGIISILLNASKIPTETKPDFIFKDLNELFNFWKNEFEK